MAKEKPATPEEPMTLDHNLLFGEACDEESFLCPEEEEEQEKEKKPDTLVSPRGITPMLANPFAPPRTSSGPIEIPGSPSSTPPAAGSAPSSFCVGSLSTFLKNEEKLKKRKESQSRSPNSLVNEPSTSKPLASQCHEHMGTPSNS